jgi:hypothetical protein
MFWPELEMTTFSSPSNETASRAPVPADGFVMVDGQEWYRIAEVDRLPPFLMSVVSDSDHWMYASSRGGLTCGRVSEHGALFPYETDDKLHQVHAHTGPYSLIRVRRGVETALWEPLRGSIDDRPIRRNLYKNLVGNQVLFEEIHDDLALAFRYRWASSDDFGFVRTVTVENRGLEPVSLDVLDGLLNLMPANAEPILQRSSSCLVNAYTRCDVDPETRLATIALSATIVDQSKPVESLRATTVWCTGLTSFDVLLSAEQIPGFRVDMPVRHEPTLKGRRGSYLVATTLRLKPGESKNWDLVADVQRSHLQVECLRSLLLSGTEIRRQIAASIHRGTENLIRNVASADGLQATADRMATSHHFANVLFNNMRGGVFARNHTVPTRDFAAFLQQRNTAVAQRRQAQLESLPADLPISQLLAWAEQTGDTDLLRLSYEYLPITFSRRHGDPSRPWNKFTIQLKNADGSQALAYQGNWRDIFQNWEALSASFPGFLPSIIAKFLSASTADGFNPYRVMREGIEWETPDPHDPWSNIGYWGDHQIIYLTRLMEASRRLNPGQLEALLTRPLFTYAQVPYRLREYSAIVANPRDTIVFDHALNKEITQRSVAQGSDGKLLPAAGAAGSIYHVTLAEKLLVPILAKLSNLVVDGGLWMNTQRPEWNDANNALVGYGVSMVTLCYLRRHLTFCRELLHTTVPQSVAMSREVAEWLRNIAAILSHHRGLLSHAGITDAQRRTVLDALGEAFGAYRRGLYARGFTGTDTVALEEVRALFAVALEYLDHAIAANRRPDGLYHAYNLLDLSTPGHAKVSHLYEMLEGQVAVLSSGALSPDAAAQLVQTLYQSKMFRPDQDSFMLYPERELPSFLEKNRVPEEAVEAIPLLSALLRAGDGSVLACDVFGRYRFNSDLRTQDDLLAALDRLAADPRWADSVKASRAAVLKVFADVFHLQAFTGRSGTMYGYEGLGCIYWHMVSKLLLAVQENWQLAAADNASSPAARRLAEAYYRVRSGLSFNKPARTYGAFPTDPYSHTPRHAGAQQPGMTGQVKEEILARYVELGVGVERGSVSFRPQLLRRREFLSRPRNWQYVDSSGEFHTMELPAQTLAFTLCQVPVIYQLAAHPQIRIILADGGLQVVDGHTLDASASRRLLARTGAEIRLEVDVPEALIALP